MVEGALLLGFAPLLLLHAVKKAIATTNSAVQRSIAFGGNWSVAVLLDVLSMWHLLLRAIKTGVDALPKTQSFVGILARNPLSSHD